MNLEDRLNALWIVLFSTSGGLVANMVDPSRRGAWGFLGAAFIGSFCGGAAGLCIMLFGSPPYVYVMVSAVVGVFGDRMLAAVLVKRMQGNQTINIHNQGIANVGDNQINGDQTDERK
jgi:hypothetical protein